MIKIHEANLAEALESDPNNLESYTVLSGYLGKSSREGHYRLYEDLSFNLYVDFKEKDVRRTKLTESSNNPKGIFLVRILEEAKVIAGGQQKMNTVDLTVFQGGFMSERESLSDKLNIGGGIDGVMAKPKSRLFRTICSKTCPANLIKIMPNNRSFRVN